MISSQYKIISIEICQITNLRLGKLPQKVLCKRLALHQPIVVFWQVGEVPIAIGLAESDPAEEEGQLLAEPIQLQHQVGEESAGGAEGGKGLSASFSFFDSSSLSKGCYQIRFSFLLYNLMAKKKAGDTKDYHQNGVSPPRNPQIFQRFMDKSCRMHLRVRYDAHFIATHGAPYRTYQPRHQHDTTIDICYFVVLGKLGKMLRSRKNI